MDNRLIPRVGAYCEMACFLTHKIGRRIVSTVSSSESVLNQIDYQSAEEDSLAQEVCNKLIVFVVFLSKYLHQRVLKYRKANFKHTHANLGARRELQFATPNCTKIDAALMTLRY